jgi:hypothetical protein
LCRRQGITAHSLVVVQAKQGRWAEKREAYRARESESFIKLHADRMAAREAEVRDHALEAIDEAITKFRADMKATKPVRQPDGSIEEEPVMLITPRDIALLVDRLQVLFHRPSTITEGRGVNVTLESLPVDFLQAFIERTRGLDEPASQASPIPRRLRPLID